MEMMKKKSNIPPRRPGQRKEAGMVHHFYEIILISSSKLEWKRATQLGALDIQKILTGIKTLNKNKA